MRPGTDQRHGRNPPDVRRRLASHSPPSSCLKNASGGPSPGGRLRRPGRCPGPTKGRGPLESHSRFRGGVARRFVLCSAFGRTPLPCRVTVWAMGSGSRSCRFTKQGQPFPIAQTGRVFRKEKNKPGPSYLRAEPVLCPCPKSRPDKAFKFLPPDLTAWALSAKIWPEQARPEGRACSGQRFADARLPQPTNPTAKTHSPPAPARTRACADGILKALGLKRVQGSALAVGDAPPARRLTG